MAEYISLPDEAERQLIQDRSVIDHLIGVFHTSGREAEMEAVQAASIYDQIRREWPVELTLGTRR